MLKLQEELKKLVEMQLEDEEDDDSEEYSDVSEDSEGTDAFINATTGNNHEEHKMVFFDWSVFRILISF